MKNNGSNLTNNNNAGKVNTESSQLDDWGFPSEDELLSGMQSAEEASTTNGDINISIEPAHLDEQEEDNTFPLHCLPDVIRNMVEEIHSANKVDKSNAAACALGMLNTALGKGIYLEDPTGRKTYAKTAIWIGAESGTGKSSMYNPLALPIENYQKALLEAWKEEATRKRAQQTNVKKQIARLKGNPAEQSDFDRLQKELEECEDFLKKPPQLVAADATDSALQDLLFRNNTQISINASEGRTIGNKILYGGQDGCLGCQVMLSLFSPTGDAQSVNRSSDGGRNYTLEDNWGNSVVLMQPDLLLKILRHEEAIETGFAGRLLFTNRPVLEPIGKRKKINPEVQERWNELVTSALETFRSGNHSVPVKISDDQDDWLTQDRDNISRRIASGELYQIREIARRWNENIYKVAVLLHVAKHGVSNKTQELDCGTLRNAKEISDWFHTNQQNALSDELEEKKRDLGKRIEGWIVHREKQHKHPTLRDIGRKFTKPNSVIEECLEPYIQSHKLAKYELPQLAGRKTVYYTSDPAGLLREMPEVRVAA